VIALHTMIIGSELIIPKANTERNLRCFGENGLIHRALRATYQKIAVTIRKLIEKKFHKELTRYNAIRTTGRLIINKNNKIVKTLESSIFIIFL